MSGLGRKEISQAFGGLLEKAIIKNIYEQIVEKRLDFVDLNLATFGREVNPTSEALDRALDNLKTTRVGWRTRR